MSGVLIRPEGPGDAAAARAVLVASFNRPAEAELVERLRCHDDTLILVAEVDGEIAGCLVFSAVTATGSGKRPVVAGLGPLAIAPSWQGQGVGTLLMNKGMEACEQRGIEVLVVLGHPDYYHRFGFRPAHTHGITCKWVVPEDAFMVKELRPGTLSRIAGRLEYRPEFDEV